MVKKLCGKKMARKADEMHDLGGGGGWQLVDGGAKANVRRGYVMGGEREREREEK